MAKQEKKTCPHYKSSSGPAMPEMFIKCHDNRIDFQNEDEFYKQFDICTHHPEDCGLKDQEKKVTPCEESQTNTGNGSCASGTTTDTAISNVDKPTVMTAQDSNDTVRKTCRDCKLFGKNKPNRYTTATHECLYIYKNGRTGTTLPINPACEHFIAKEEPELEIIPEKQLCIKDQKDCPYYCSHNKGCALLIVSKKALPNIMKQSGEVECGVYWEKTNVQKTAENGTFLIENVQKNEEIVTFDYSSVDEETGEFLQEKANRIIQIRTMSALAIGKELKEAHEKLSNHKTGTFGVWCESIGISDRNARRYIAAHNYIRTNCPDMEIAENIPTSLLFEVSKPSAPPELQEAVLSGDITTHKQYKELEQKLRDAEFHCERVSTSYKHLEKVNSEHYRMRVAAEKDVQKLLKEKSSAINELNETKQRLEWARKNGDPEKIQKLEQEIRTLRQQLMDKPIEATASKVIEVIPEDIEATQYHLKNYAKVNTILEMVENLSTEEMQSWARMMNDRNAVNDADESCWIDVLGTAIQNLQDMMDDYRQGVA